MLILADHGLVYLANPKTATQAVRAMLGPFAMATPQAVRGKHIGVPGYLKNWQVRMQAAHGPLETFAVMRDPVERLGSWYRYRARDAIAGSENSTAGMTFQAFVAAVLQDDPPSFARVGRQDVFLAAQDGKSAVDRLFDYAQIGVMIAFLQDRLGCALRLGVRNVSPAATAALVVSDGLMAQLRTARAEEFALYDAVRTAGVLTGR